MKRLSFGCTINHLDCDIAEVIVDSGVELGIEMVEELDNYLSHFYPGDFALLINKQNQYSYTFEAELCLASLEHQRALAILYHDRQNEHIPPQLNQRVALDDINIKIFPATKLGITSAINWLKDILIKAR
ncbi:hypothetical protein HWQ46_10990 [Shewanella sp. D64]|uniref:hypothetical protein n=1 Tax=unclassified Shewanella TaxID=196818 RepID=UPI0022BA4E89|nr:MULTISPECIES: hypothetical protein [unclassified Shewanella]MEC4726073.1 hypothetical protein [Shewanella sp. D64]MEC4738010.1 hypothetical protein [Shewanella sp. E94]WBJ96209.1 hypothetical protein HWQ47_03495 [Shewanella sp. MTB7]